MTEIVESSRSAREKLAEALNLLQSPNAGSLIETVAEPVARAMGALHSIESTGGASLSEKAPVARDAVRAALAALQGAEMSEVAEQALAHVAASLGLVHGLAELGAAHAGDTAAMASSSPQATDQKAPTATPPTAASPAGMSGLEKTQLASDETPGKAGAFDTTRQPAVAQAVAMPATAGPAAGKSAESPLARTQQSNSGQSVEAPRPVIEQSIDDQAARSSKHAPAPTGGKPAGVQDVEANLGAHSPTNFYKGLSGNDVVDDGGLFVATYDIPALGSQLWITVNMPGGYDFQALAAVKWTRESGVGDAPPGFGCTFQSLSDDARRLVYRYVKNREPLFHDDL